MIQKNIIKREAYSGIRSFGWTQLITVLGQVLVLYILLRYLQPEDFGILAIANLIILFAGIFADSGLTSAVIAKKDFTKGDFSAVLLITLLISSILTAIVYFSSFSLSRYFEIQDYYGLIQILSPIIIINAITAIFYSYFRRQLLFLKANLITLIGFLVYAVVTILMAIKGYGVKSLIYGTLFSSIIKLFIIPFLGIKKSEIVGKIKTTSLNYYFNFGSFQIIEKILNYFTKDLDQLLIGKTLGAELLGSFNVIKRLLRQPISTVTPIINNVSLPLLSKSSDDSSIFTTVYTKTLTSTTLINFYIYSFLILFGNTLVLLFFGSEWEQFTNIFMLLSAYFLFYSIGSPAGTLILSKSKIKLSLFWNIAVAVVSIPLLIIATSNSLLWTARALLAIQILFFYPCFHFLVKPNTSLNFYKYIQLLFRIAFISFTPNIIAWAITFSIIDNALIRFVLSAILSIALFIYLNIEFNKSTTIDFLNVLKLDSLKKYILNDESKN